MSVSARIGNDISMLFPTLLLQRQPSALAPFNDGLRALALALEARASDVRKSNVGGYQSEPDLFSHPATRDLAPVVALRGEVMRALRDMTAVLRGGVLDGVTLDDPPACWVNINRDGDYNLLHHHLPATWAGCYYVDAGDPDRRRPLNGHFEIHDPRTLCHAPSADMLGHRAMTTIEPVSGMLLLFPGYATHMVHPYFGARERISVAFNCGARRRDVG